MAEISAAIGSRRGAGGDARGRDAVEPRPAPPGSRRRSAARRARSSAPLRPGAVDEFFEPTTSTRSQSAAIRFTASWRLVVAQQMSSLWRLHRRKAALDGDDLGVVSSTDKVVWVTKARRWDRAARTVPHRRQSAPPRPRVIGPGCRSPRGSRRGRSARLHARPWAAARRRGGPWRPGRWRRGGALCRRAAAGTALGTPWAEKTTGRSSGAWSSSSTNTAPRAFSRSDHMLVVDDLVADIDRLPVFLDRPFDDVDGAVDPGAEPSGRSQKHTDRPLDGGGRAFI